MNKTVNILFFRRYMEREGINQTELAVRLRKSTTTISNMMNGIAPKRPRDRKEIADTVAADVDFIFPEADQAA